MNGEAADNAPQMQTDRDRRHSARLKRPYSVLGEVQLASQPGVYARTDGTIAAYTVEVGDSVKAVGHVARLENDEPDADIEQLEYDLQTAQQGSARATQTHTQYVFTKNFMTRTAIWQA